MTSSATRLVVVGADAAGMSAAHQAMRTARGHGRALDVVALEKTQHTSYSACGLPYWVAGDVDDPDQLVARSPARHREMGIDLRTGATATALDLDRGTVSYRTGTGATELVEYDQLVLATGAAPILPTWARQPGGEPVPGVHPLKDLDDGAVWVEVLERAAPLDRPRHAVVVGGGYIGVEMTEALVRRGWSATLITRSAVMSSLDVDMSERIETAVRESGVEVLPHLSVTHLELSADGAVAAVVTSDGKSHPTDAVVVAMGVTPSTGFGAAAGLPVGRSGGYLIDDTGRLADRVWAAGDCCESRHRLTGESVFLPLGTHANKQGRVVGVNLGGGEARFGGVLGTAITRYVTDAGHVEIARTGLSSWEAEVAGLDATALVTEGRTASGYMPEASPMATRVVAEKGTRRLLGLQIVGGHGSGKRIDTAAAALWGGLTVDDLAGMDLAYAPPFATVWEAVQLAARRLADRM